MLYMALFLLVAKLLKVIVERTKFGVKSIIFGVSVCASAQKDTPKIMSSTVIACGKQIVILSAILEKKAVKFVCTVQPKLNNRKEGKLL